MRAGAALGSRTGDQVDHSHNVFVRAHGSLYEVCVNQSDPVRETRRFSICYRTLRFPVTIVSVEAFFLYVLNCDGVALTVAVLVVGA